MSKRGDFEPRVEEVAVGGRGVGDDDYAQAGAVGGDVAGDGVLEGDGVGGVHAESTEGGEIHVGLGFSDGDIVAAGDEIEEWQHAAMGEVSLDVGVRGVGGETDAKAGGAGGVEQFECAGEGRGGKRECVGGEAVAFFKGSAVDFRRVGGPVVVDDIGVADDVVEDVAIDGDAVLGVDLHPGVDQHGFGVHQESVEVEDEGAQHGQVLPFAADGSTQAVKVV